MKTILVTISVLAALLSAFIFAGSLEQNHMISIGLLIAIISGLSTIAITITSRMQAMKTCFDPTPIHPENASAYFKNIANAYSYRTELDRQLELLRQDVSSLKQDQKRAEFDIRVLQTHMRICFDMIRYHEEITLPQALSGQAGAIVTTTLLTLMGTAMTATPDLFYSIAQWLYLESFRLWQATIATDFG